MTARAIRILGVDPGLRRTGWGVIEILGNRLTFVGCGSVESSDILKSVESCDGLRKTRAIAEDYARKAQRMLEEFPASPYRDAISHIPEFILNRTA